MKIILWGIQVAVFYLFTLAVASIPAGSVTAVGRWTGLFIRLVLPGRRRIAEDNIRQALPYMKRQPEWTCTLETAEEKIGRASCRERV